MMKFDAHAHSIVSDGTQSPAALIETAAAAGLDFIALTDHDTDAGIAEARRAGENSGVEVIAGIEMSSTYGGISAHILAYLPDSKNPELEQVLTRIRHSRVTRAWQMAQNLAVDYPNANWEQFDSSGDRPWGRPHLADALVAAGYFSNRDEAFTWALSPKGPYYVHQWSPTPPEAVEVIRRAHGVPVLAHPFSARRRALPEAVVAEMVEAGLFGIERDHREHDSRARFRADRLAQGANLETTGGSDYHGAGKPNRLGENLTAPEVLEKILEQGYSGRK